jgi:hydroxymethylbilane synthase
MSEPTLRIATRQSRLALWQAEHVATRLRALHPQLQVVLVPMTTQGDRVTDRALAEVGGKGLFIKELELALEENRADIAVHSMKDVPTDMPPGMSIVSMLTRADAHDAFVSRHFTSFDALPPAAKVGTSSLRRQCQLKAARPDLEMLLLRGNVETRLRKLDEGQYDAIILASAGLIRLGLASRITHPIAFDRSLPAVGQGIVGIECRSEDARNIALVRDLNDEDAWICCTAERAFAQRLQGSCQSPIAGFAERRSNVIVLQGVVGSPDGSKIYRGTIDGAASNAATLGVELANRLLSAGADVLLAEQRAHSPTQLP